MKNLILISIIIGSFLSSFAQDNSAWMENYIFTKSTYIFDGKIIEQKSYYDGSQILTSNLVVVTNIYRGADSLIPGTVEVVTEGGWVDHGRFKAWEGEHRINQNICFTFFCAPIGNWHGPSGTVSDNNMSLKIIGSYSNHNLNKTKLYFKTTNEFYNYLKQKDYIILPEKIKAYNDSINKINFINFTTGTDTTGFY